MNSRYCYILSVKNAHHHKYFENKPCYRNLITQTQEILERLKSGKDVKGSEKNYLLFTYNHGMSKQVRVYRNIKKLIWLVTWTTKWELIDQ